jgi:hypothetical protein
MDKAIRKPPYLLLFAAIAFASILGCTQPSGDPPAGKDTTAPTVSSTVPADLATGVAVNSAFSVTFSEAMLPSSITSATFTAVGALSAVVGVVTYSGETATFTPSANLANSTLYTATVTVGATDLAGNALAVNKVWTFTTSALADTNAPTVSSTVPADLATDVAINSAISATFSEAMLVSSITDVTFTATGTPAITGVVTYSGNTATFTPSANLASGTLYTATVTTGAKDLASNALAANKVWTFTTGTSVALGPAPVILGAAGDYAILAESTVASQTSPTVVAGNIGISPAALTFITGFTMTPHEVTAGVIDYTNATQVTGGGRIYAADMTGGSTSANLTTAIAHKLIAYNDAAGRTVSRVLNVGAGTIGVAAGTLNFVPGLYNWNTALHMTGDITLTGGANDVWIFQVNGTLTVDSAKKVILAGGALPKNIFWQITGNTSLGTGSHFEGVILCASDIWLLTGATMNGRTLSATQVVLQTATVTQPAP